MQQPTSIPPEQLPPAGVTQHRPLARIAVRMMLEFMLSAAAVITRMGEGNFDLGIFLISLIQANRSLGVGRNAPSPGLSVSALAASFGRPFETVRRHANLLIVRGICVRTSAGVSLSPIAFADPVLSASLTEMHDLTIRLIQDLTGVGYPMPTASGDGAPSFDLVARAGIDLSVSTMDIGSPRHEDWTGMLLYTAIMVANARGITFDPALAHLYSESSTPPPEETRRPVRARALSRALQVPYPTLRRHLARLEEEGRIVRRQSGYIIPMKWLQHPAMLASGGLMSQRLVTMLGRLAAAGFPFDRAEALYRRGRPPLIDFS